MGITASIVSAGVTGYGLYKQHKANQAAERTQATILGSAPNLAADQARADQAALNAGAAQKKKTNAAQGFRSTILTGPQGVPSAPVPGGPQPYKTVLGGS